jgi:hypothetical protein
MAKKEAPQEEPEEEQAQQKPEQDPIGMAVQSGFQNLIKRHPAFGRSPNLVQNYLDRNALRKEIFKISSDAKEQNLDDEEAMDYIQSGIQNYVGSGQALNEEGKSIILGQYKNPSKKDLSALHGDEYISGVASAFRSLYDLMSSNKSYAEKMPEAYASLQKLDEAHFLNASVNMLRHEGLLDEATAKDIKTNLEHRARTEAEKVVNSIKSHATLEDKVQEKVAASIIGIVGLGAVVSSGMNLTGRAIGDAGSATVFGIVGSVLFIISLLMLVDSFKESSKLKKLKKSSSKKLVSKKSKRR